MAKKKLALTDQKLAEIILFRENLKRMEHSLELYQSKFAGKRFSLSLANGERIQLAFTKHIIAHFLGLKYSYLVEHPLFENLSSYQCLEYIMNHSVEVIEEIINGNLVVKKMFSHEFERKNLAIERTPLLENQILNQIVFVCPYDQKSHLDSNKKPIQSDYVVGIRNEENDMSLFGLIQNKETGKFHINSNLLVLNGINYFKELGEFISNQTLTYANYAKIYNYNSEVDDPKMVYLQEKEKLVKLDVLRYYQERLNIKIDTTAETERQLNEIIKLKEFKTNTYEFVNFLKEKIKKREEIYGEECQTFDAKHCELVSLTNELINKMNVLETFADTVVNASQTYEKEKKRF